MDKDNFCISITPENREEVKKWYEEQDGGDYFLFNLKAHYGRLKGQLEQSDIARPPFTEVISWEEFQRHILNKEPINDYQIY